MTVFVRYSSRDRDAVQGLIQDLQDADEQVWIPKRNVTHSINWRPNSPADGVRSAVPLTTARRRRAEIASK